MIKFAFYWVWGVVIPFTPWDEGGSTVLQALACKSELKRGEVYQAIDCVALGPAMTMVDGECNRLLVMARADMPERTIRTCVSVKLSDLQRLR